MVLRFSPFTSSKPSKSKDITNPFGKPDSQTLCAGFKLSPFQVVNSWLGWRFAEYRQQSAGK